jgi:hypothetical protein
MADADGGSRAWAPLPLPAAAAGAWVCLLPPTVRFFNMWLLPVLGTCRRRGQSAASTPLLLRAFRRGGVRRWVPASLVRL